MFGSLIQCLFATSGPTKIQLRAQELHFLTHVRNLHSQLTCQKYLHFSTNEIILIIRILDLVVDLLIDPNYRHLHWLSWCGIGWLQRGEKIRELWPIFNNYNF